MDERPVLELTDVAKRYDAPEGGESVEVLRGVSLALAPGRAVAVTGPSGSGKSTLLNLIAALDRPSAGRVVLDGEDLAALSDNDLAAVRNRKVGLVFQLHHLLPQCTVWENVLVPTLARGGDRSAEERAKRLLDRVRLGGRLSHRPAHLSGGERQRVAVVRALINEPKLLLADEPTGSLDRAASENLADLLGELNREEGVTLVVATHSMRLAGRVGDVLALRDGRLEAAEEG
jgi:ABC-type lipoprotein export system ATPase subunit